MVDMKKVIKGIWNVVEVLIMIYVVIMTVFFLNKNRFGFTEIGKSVYVSVDRETAKELSGTKNFDLFIIKKDNNIDGKSKAYYYSSSKDNYVVKEGVVSVDNNNAFHVNDTLISSERVIGKKGMKIPLVGGFLRLIENKVGFIVFVFLPIFLVFIFRVYEFISYSKKEQIIAADSISDNCIKDDEII